VTVLSVMGLVTTAPGVVAGRIWYRRSDQEEPVNLLEGLERFAKYLPGPPLRAEKDNRRWLRWHEAGMRERRGLDLAMIFQNLNALHPTSRWASRSRRRSGEGLPDSRAEAVAQAQEWLAKVHSRRAGEAPRLPPQPLGACQRVMIAWPLPRARGPHRGRAHDGPDATIQSRVLDLLRR
jgi:ABC-type dipeptide/oligopeptide/nickel transport system ATPase component